MRVNKIILPSRPVELIFFMALLKRLKRNSIFLDIRDVWPDALDIENKRKKRIFEIYCNIYLRPSLRAYTNTFHVAPSFQTWLHRYAPECPSVFIPLGWENDRWPGNPTPHIIDVNNRIRLVCVAQLQYQIDIRPVLEVLAGNERLHLTIIGEDGSGERYSHAKDYIDQKNIKNIQIIGKVSRTEVVRLLKEQDFGILPMISTFIPNKIFDYMASFLPTIVLGENDSADFVVSNGIGWSCKYNSNDLNKLIDSFSNEDIIEKKERVIQVREMYSRNQTHKTILETIS